MKKYFMALFMVIGLVCSTGVAYAEEGVLLPDELNQQNVVNDSMELESDMECSSLEGYEMLVLNESVDAEGCWDLFTKVNELRVSKGELPLKLSYRATQTAMRRAQEINTVYLHEEPNHGHQQLEIPKIPGSENLSIGHYSGLSSYYSFENSAAHYCNMINSIDDTVGVGNYGTGYVLVFDCDPIGYYKEDYEMTKDQLISMYKKDSLNAEVLVDTNQYSTMAFKPFYYQSNMDMGTTQQLTATVTPHPATIKNISKVNTPIVATTLNWTSSNTAVATVNSNGVVTAKKTGTSVITAKLYNHVITYNINVTSNGSPIEEELTDYLVKYRTHVQNVGWQSYVPDGLMSGTEGRSLRLEGINVALDKDISGGIEYRTHVQNVGWQSYVGNDVMSGTSGRSLRLEGINIRLTGEAAELYDVYYRTHVQNIGWMAWAKNDEASGSAGYSWRLEGIQIQISRKRRTSTFRFRCSS